MSVGLFRKFMFRAARQGTLKQITLETCKHLHKLLLFGFKVTMERPTTIKISKRFKMPRGLQNIPAKTIFNPIYKSNAVFFPYWILIPFTIGQSSLYPVSAWVFQLVFSWPSELPWLRADAEASLFKGVPLGQDPRATCSGTEPEKKNLRTNSQTFFFCNVDCCELLKRISRHFAFVALLYCTFVNSTVSADGANNCSFWILTISTTCDPI